MNVTLTSDVIVWRCDACHDTIGDGEGYLTVDMHAARRATVGMIQWDADHRGRIMSASQIAGRPGPARWRCYHDTCAVPPSIGAYCIDVDEARTCRSLLRWTAHLSPKNWYPGTDWVSVIRQVAHP